MDSFDRRWATSRRSHDRVKGMIKVIMALVVLFIVGYFAVMAYAAISLVDMFSNGVGLRDMLETVWCGSSNPSCLN